MDQKQYKVLKLRLTTEMFLDLTGNKEKVFDAIMQESGAVDPPDPAQETPVEPGSKEAGFPFGLKVEPPSAEEKKILDEEAQEQKELAAELAKVMAAKKAAEEAAAKKAADDAAKAAADHVPEGEAKPPVPPADPFATPAQVY